MTSRALLGGLLAAAIAAPAWAGNLDLFGIDTDYKITLGYALAVRTEQQSQALINGPVDTMHIIFNPGPGGGIGGFTNTGLPITTNFDDANRDFERGAQLNNRVSAFGQVQFKLDNLGLGELGFVSSGAAHYDQVFQELNDHDNPDSVNRIDIDANGNRFGPVNEWSQEAQDTNRKRHRLLEAYGYGQWYLTETMALSLRLGKHLAAWGESLFFPGIVSAQGPFDATKAFVPGAEIKEILLPVNQASMQLQLTPDITLLAYNQFEFKPTEIFPEGDFFSPADLVGPGSKFGYGSINPLHPDRCNEPDVRDPAGNPVDNSFLCAAGDGFENKPEYIYTVRTEDKLPGDADQWGIGLKYAGIPNWNLGGYYLHYNNHNPNVILNMGYARVGDSGGTPVTTESFGVRVPVSYTIAYADDVEMAALSFSTVFWVFNIGGELIHRANVDTSVEATIAGVVAPIGTRGDTTTAQVSFLYVENPDFLMYDEVVVVGEMGYTQVDKVDPRTNEDGICYTGTSDCRDFTQQGDTLFYDRSAAAIQILVLPKGRNVAPGWDIGTPINFAWMPYGTPSTPGIFGSLYGEGDMRLGIGVTAQFVQNLEFSLNYNAFLGDEDKFIGRSTLHANPYVDHDYASFTIKYNL